MTPEQFVKERKPLLCQAEWIRKSIQHMETIAENCEFPKYFRPATPEDIIVENVIWYQGGDDGIFWQIIEEVYRSCDNFKAYCGEDGCRYGLDGAFVRVNDNDFEEAFNKFTKITKEKGVFIISCTKEKWCVSSHNLTSVVKAAEECFIPRFNNGEYR